MKKNILATSIIEAMVVLLIVLIAVTGAYDMFSNAIRITDGSEHKLMAISMAKEGIEAVTNIRDTNWKVLP
jgi:Tfp pilus assembly protein PilV